MKKFTMTGMIIGSFIGSYIPALWGDGSFSMSSMLLGVIGGVAGIWAGYKIGQNFV